MIKSSFKILMFRILIKMSFSSVVVVVVVTVVVAVVVVVVVQILCSKNLN